MLAKLKAMNVKNGFDEASWKTFTRLANDIDGNSELLASLECALDVLLECTSTGSQSTSTLKKHLNDERLYVILFIYFFFKFLSFEFKFLLELFSIVVFSLNALSATSLVGDTLKLKLYLIKQLQGLILFNYSVK